MAKKNPSRAERYSDAQNKISEALIVFVSLKEELQSWLDNMPENLQNSNRASMLETAVEEIEGIVEHLEEVESTSVDFPTMFG